MVVIPLVSSEWSVVSQSLPTQLTYWLFGEQKVELSCHLLMLNTAARLDLSQSEVYLKSQAACVCS